MNDEDVLKALRALAESDREREAPARVERKLKSAFRATYRKRRVWPYFVLPAMAAAVAMVVFTVNLQRKPQTMEIAVATPKVVNVTTPHAPVAIDKAAYQKPVPTEIVTDFFPLIEDPQPFQGGELLRVRVSAMAMRSVGLPVSEDRVADTVQADVLVGDEGIARAIRFVRYVN